MPSLGRTYREGSRHARISIAGDRRHQVLFHGLGKECFLERPRIVHVAACSLRRSQWNSPQIDSFDPPKKSLILGAHDLMDWLHQRDRDYHICAARSSREIGAGRMSVALEVGIPATKVARAG